jgi:hypothetical protein
LGPAYLLRTPGEIDPAPHGFTRFGLARTIRPGFLAHRMMSATMKRSICREQDEEAYE